MIRPKYFSGDGTLLEAGTDATHGERNRASVVAFAMASEVPTSGTSDCASGLCAKASGVRKRKARMIKGFIRFSSFEQAHRAGNLLSREKFRQSAWETVTGAFLETLGIPL